MLDWSDTWQMPLDVSNFQVPSQASGQDNQEFDYFVGSNKLEVVKEQRDLGEQFTDNLKSSRQCQLANSKASKVLGMIGRTISYKNADLLVRLYKSLVRPHLEYCVSTWSPSYVKNSKLLERMQHMFTRMVPKLKKLSYEKRLDWDWGLLKREEIELTCWKSSSGCRPTKAGQPHHSTISLSCKLLPGLEDIQPTSRNTDADFIWDNISSPSVM